MPMREAYMKVTVWVPPERPGFPEAPEYPWVPGGPGPGQGLPGEGEIPDFPWVPGGPGIGGGPIIPPGFPERPGQGLPRPPRPVYPVVDDPDDLGGHPEVPDLAMTRRIKITDGTDEYTGYVLNPEPPQVEDDYEPRLPSRGLPGTWVAVLYGAALAWAWIRTPGAAPEPGEPGQGLPGDPEREPKRY